MVELLRSGARLAELLRLAWTSILDSGAPRGFAQRGELVVEIGNVRYVAQLKFSICISET